MSSTHVVYLLLICLFLPACGEIDAVVESDNDVCEFQSTTQLSVGLTIYKAAEGELCGSYRSGDMSIHFHTQRGEKLVHGENTVDPDAPEYSVNARILDQTGQPIAVSIGDSDSDPSYWLTSISRLEHEPIPEDDSSYYLAQEAMAELAHHPSIGDFPEELRVLTRRSYTGAPTKDDINDDSQITKSSQWRYWIRIMKKYASWSGRAGDHSAVIVNVRRPDGRIFNYVTCNHGTCADSQSMNYKCQKIVYTSRSRPFSVLPCDQYTSYGLQPGRHVCNDDTYMQYNMIVRGSTSSSTCRDWSLRRRAPSCN